MSFVYCILYIYILSAFAEYIAWALIVVVQLGLFGFSFICLSAWLEVKGTNDPNEKNYLVGSIIGTVLTLVFCMLVWCGFNSLRIAINVIDASADFIADTKRIIGVPVLYFFVTLIMVLIWLFCCMSINTIGDITPRTDLFIQGRKVGRDDGSEKKTVNLLLLFMLFGIFWICAFIRAKSSFILMVSASTYYFDHTEAKREGGVADVGYAFRIAYFNHAGSLAFGSCIIAIIQFIRIIFVTLAEQAQKASGDNAAVKIIVSCANCCLKSLEKICDYINKGAYAYMAVSGDSFCKSAWNGFLLNMKHCLEFGFANFLASAFIFLGKVGLVVLNCFSCYMIMKHITKDIEEISSPAGPLAVVGVVTYISASIFLGIFDETVMALMTCLAIDTDLNIHPKFGPSTFHDHLETMPKPVNKKAIQNGDYEMVQTKNAMH